MKYYLQFIFLSLIIFSCDTPSEKVENKVEAAKEKVEIIKDNQIEKELAQIKQVEIEEGGIEIKFEDFQVNIDSVLIYDAEGSLNYSNAESGILKTSCFMQITPCFQPLLSLNDILSGKSTKGLGGRHIHTH